MNTLFLILSQDNNNSNHHHRWFWPRMTTRIRVTSTRELVTINQIKSLVVLFSGCFLGVIALAIGQIEQLKAAATTTTGRQFFSVAKIWSKSLVAPTHDDDD